VTAPLLTARPAIATRDAVKKALESCRPLHNGAPVRLLNDSDVGHVMHMLFSSGALIDPATLADDEALRGAVGAEIDHQATINNYGRRPDGLTGGHIIAKYALRALAAALAEATS